MQSSSSSSSSPVALTPLGGVQSPARSSPQVGLAGQETNELQRLAEQAYRRSDFQTAVARWTEALQIEEHALGQRQAAAAGRASESFGPEGRAALLTMAVLYANRAAGRLGLLGNVAPDDLSLSPQDRSDRPPTRAERGKARHRSRAARP